MGIIKFFQARESLISDIPPGDGKMANLFYSVSIPYSPPVLLPFTDVLYLVV
jgi:hypothetical protein